MPSLLRESVEEIQYVEGHAGGDRMWTRRQAGGGGWQNVVKWFAEGRVSENEKSVVPHIYSTV